MDTNDNIKRALNPDNFKNITPRTRAIVGFMIGMKYVKPELWKIRVNEDGTLIGAEKNKSRYTEPLGTLEEFKSKWTTLIHLPNLGLSAEEVQYLEELPGVTIKNYGE